MGSSSPRSRALRPALVPSAGVDDAECVIAVCPSVGDRDRFDAEAVTHTRQARAKRLHGPRVAASGRQLFEQAAVLGPDRRHESRVRLAPTRHVADEANRYAWAGELAPPRPHRPTIITRLWMFVARCAARTAARSLSRDSHERAGGGLRVLPLTAIGSHA